MAFLPTNPPATLRQWLLRSLLWTSGSIAASIVLWYGYSNLPPGFRQFRHATGLPVLILSNMLGCWLVWRRAIWTFHPLIEQPPPAIPWWLPPLATSWWIVLVLLGVGWLLLDASVVLLGLGLLVDSQGLNPG